jgi:hypothetical protein
MQSKAQLKKGHTTVLTNKTLSERCRVVIDMTSTSLCSSPPFHAPFAPFQRNRVGLERSSQNNEQKQTTWMQLTLGARRERFSRKMRCSVRSPSFSSYLFPHRRCPDVKSAVRDTDGELCERRKPSRDDRNFCCSSFFLSSSIARACHGNTNEQASEREKEEEKKKKKKKKNPPLDRFLSSSLSSPNTLS